MPYTDVRQANAAILGIRPKVNLEQANWIAKVADALAQDEKTQDSAWAIAISQFKKSFTVRGHVWKKRAEVEAAARAQQQRTVGSAAIEAAARAELRHAAAVRTRKEFRIMAEKVTKRVNGEDLGADDFLVVPDAEKPSTWKLPVSVKGKLDHRLMGAAAAALTVGFRGNKYEGPEKAAALKKLKALYDKEEMMFPEHEQEQESAARSASASLSEMDMDNMYMPSTVTSFAQLDAAIAAQEQAEQLRSLTNAYQQLLWNIIWESSVVGADKISAMRTLTDEYFLRLQAAMSSDMTAGEETQDAQAEEAQGSAFAETAVQLSEARTADVQLEEAANNGTLYVDVQIIKPGWGNQQDNNYYPADMLAACADKFVGAKMFETDHNQAEKSTRTWVSTVKSINGFTEEGSPVARVAVHDPSFAQRLRNLQDAGMLDKMECSILALGKARAGFKLGERVGKQVDSIEEVLSVDWVTRAGAGGKALALAESADGVSGKSEDTSTADSAAAQDVQTAAENAKTSVSVVISEEGAESAQDAQQADMLQADAQTDNNEDTAAETAQQVTVQKLSIEEQRALLTASRLPAAAQMKLIGKDYADSAALAAAIEAEAAYVKEVTQSGKVFGLGENTSTARSGLAALEEVNARKDAVNHKYFKS